MRDACPLCSSGQKDIGDTGQKVKERLRNQKDSEKEHRINTLRTNQMYKGSYSDRALRTLKPPQTFNLRQFHAQTSPLVLIRQNISARV